MIEMERVSKTYETGCKAVKNVSFTIADGEFVLLWARAVPGKVRCLNSC